MGTQVESPQRTGYDYVSTGHLPSPEVVKTLMAEAYERFKSNVGGRNSDVYPALARVPSDLFGTCVVGTNGHVYAVGDTEYAFSIMSVSKPFVFALVCQSIGAERAREKLGANSTGLPFNSLTAIERSVNGRTNPMVNAGAIATTSLVPGTTVEAKWRFIRRWTMQETASRASSLPSSFPNAWEWICSSRNPRNRMVGPSESIACAGVIVS
jgi:glutaminase